MRPMLCPERNTMRSGFHNCLGSRKPMLCSERNKSRLGFQKCLGSRKPMLCPGRNEIRLGFHKCLGSRMPVLCPERDEIRLGFHKVSRCSGGPCRAQNEVNTVTASPSVSTQRRPKLRPERRENCQGLHTSPRLQGAHFAWPMGFSSALNLPRSAWQKARTWKFYELF